MHPKHPVAFLNALVQQHRGTQVVLLILWLVLVYMELPLAVNATQSIPSFPLLVLLPVVVPIVGQSPALRTSIIFSLVLLLPAVISALFSLGDLGLGAMAVRLSQYAYSLLMACVTLNLVLGVKPGVVRKTLMLICLTMIAGIILERIGLLRPLTAAFRTLYEGTAFGGEIDALREESLVGFVRPIFFTSEPSLVGMGFFAFGSGFLVVNDRPVLDMMAPIGILMVFVCLGSPAILLALVFWAIVMSVRYKVSWAVWGISLGALGLVGWLVIQSGVAAALWESLVIRFQEEIFQEGTSLYSRIYLPFTQTLPLALQQHPLFGVGYGNHAGVSALFGFRGELDPFENQFIIGSNATANFVTYMGLVGLTLNVAALAWVARQLKAKPVALLLAFWLVLGQTIGTFSPPRFWCYCFMFAGCLCLFYPSSSKQANDRAI
jgi:hypothetical protein